MKISLAIVCFSCLCTLFTFCQEQKKATQVLSLEKLKIKAQLAKAYCKKNKMDTSGCILIDMSIHSGLERLVFWDFEKDTILKSMLVGHGCGKSNWGEDGTKEKPIFSNQNSSHCSSLGKYKIGERGFSNWGIGIKYLLHGLEASNSNALKRTVVLHGWENMSDQEIYPNGSPEGWGCPTLSNNNMTWADLLLKTKKMPSLLWIFI